MNISNYILQILKSQLCIMMSWGFSQLQIIDNGIKFHVSGFVHQGYVEVVYNEGKDLFEVIFLDKKNKEVKRIDDVYFDQLVDVIDSAVEHTNDYEKKVSESLNQ